MKILKEVVFNVSYKTVIEVDEEETIDSNIEIEIPSGINIGCNYVENSFNVVSSQRKRIEIGDYVIHKRFGKGKVTNINKLGNLHGYMRTIEVNNRYSDDELNFTAIKKQNKQINF